MAATSSVPQRRTVLMAAGSMHVSPRQDTVAHSPRPLPRIARPLWSSRNLGRLFATPSSEWRHRGRTSMLSRRQFVGSTVAATAALASKEATAQSKRTIVDAQVHLWKAESEDWKWVPGMKPQLPEPFT